MEVWKIIEDTDGVYSVSNKGRVRNNQKGKLVKTNSINFYHRANIVVGGKKRVPYVHRLVAYAFLPPPLEENMVVNHKDEDITNNCVENLEWVTTNYNLAYSWFNSLSEEEKRLFVKHIEDNHSHLLHKV